MRRPGTSRFSSPKISPTPETKDPFRLWQPSGSLRPSLGLSRDQTKSSAGAPGQSHRELPETSLE